MNKRVAALSHTDKEKKEIYFFGYGEYVGDFVPGEEVAGDLGKQTRNSSFKNPKIILDSGQVIWGCECWWSDEDIIKQQFSKMESEGWKIINLDIEEEREKISLDDDD